jgi:enoyl-CoA hydratase/carnithine racemase
LPSWAVKDGIAVVDLANWAWAYNGYHALSDVVEQLQADDSVRVVVITGSPTAEPRPVSIGFYGHEQFTRYVETFLFRLHKPFVIAVDGFYRHGITLMLLADIVVAEEQVSWSDSHVVAGTVSASGPFLWPLLTGLNAARRYIFTGEPFTAREGKEMGIVTEVVDSGTSLAAAMKYATRMAELEPRTLQMTKRTMNQWFKLSFDAVLQRGLGLEWLTIPEAIDASDRPWEKAQ